MKIEININEDIEDIEIVFSCRKLTPAVERMLVMDKKLTVLKEDETYFLDVTKVIYLESVDRKTFVYTEDAVYESRLKLYELEQQLDEYGFFRANKSCLIQLKYVRSLKADINRKIKVTLEDGEQVMVSRQYAEGLKKKLGVK